MIDALWLLPVALIAVLIGMCYYAALKHEDDRRE